MLDVEFSFRDRVFELFQFGFIFIFSLALVLIFFCINYSFEIVAFIRICIDIKQQFSWI